MKFDDESGRSGSAGPSVVDEGNFAASTPRGLSPAERADLAIEDDRGLGPADSGAACVPKHLSPSSSGVYRQCARKWKFRYVDKLPDPPGEAALAGTFAHRVLEMLLQCPPSERTPEVAKRLARHAWPETAADPDFIALGLDDNAERQFRWRGWTAIEGLWAIEDPETVQVHATEHDVKVAIGEVPFRGIIDRVDVVADDLVVSDYKSGRAPRERFQHEPLTQVMLYAAALRAMTGQVPRQARLLYLGQRIISAPVDNESLDQAAAALDQTWSSIVRDCGRADFDVSTGPLCAWCPFVDRCAEGQAEVRRRDAAGMVRPDAPALAVLPAAS